MKVYVVVPQGCTKLKDVPNLLEVCRTEACAEKHLQNRYDQQCKLFDFFRRDYPSFEIIFAGISFTVIFSFLRAVF